MTNPVLRRLGALVVALALTTTAGCFGKDDKSDQSEQAAAPKQVDLTYTLPAGMTEVPVPTATPKGGVNYDIKLYRGTDGCQLRVVRLVVPKGDGTEDQDATYNMVGAIMKQSGITKFTVNGVMVPGEPGPVPALTGSGAANGAALRVAGRMSNGSLQGFQLVYGCEKAKLKEANWTALVGSLKVDGFQGSLAMH